MSRKRQRVAADPYGKPPLVSLFATEEYGLAVQPELRPLLWDSSTQGIDSTANALSDPSIPKNYQVFHAYSPSGENPYQIEWSRAYTGIAGIRINRVTFPISFLLFEDDQILTYQPEGGDAIQFTIPYGNYSFRELVNWFHRESGFAIQLAKNAAGQAVFHLRTVSGATRFLLSFAQATALQTALGYEQTTYDYSDCALYTISRTSGISIDGYSITGEKLINLSLPPFLYLQATNSTTAMTGDGVETGKTPINNILCTIPLFNNSGAIVNWTNPSQDFLDCATNRDYVFDTFTFLNPSGSVVSFNAPFDIELGCKMINPYFGASMINRFSRTDFSRPPPVPPTNLLPQETYEEDDEMYYDPPTGLPTEDDNPVRDIPQEQVPTE